MIVNVFAITIREGFPLIHAIIIRQPYASPEDARTAIQYEIRRYREQGSDFPMVFAVELDSNNVYLITSPASESPPDS